MCPRFEITTTNAGDDLDTVEHRHADVEQDHVWMGLSGDAEPSTRSSSSLQRPAEEGDPLPHASEAITAPAHRAGSPVVTEESSAAKDGPRPAIPDTRVTPAATAAVALSVPGGLAMLIAGSTASILLWKTGLHPRWLMVIGVLHAVTWVPPVSGEFLATFPLFALWTIATGLILIRTVAQPAFPAMPQHA